MNIPAGSFTLYTSRLFIYNFCMGSSSDIWFVIVNPHAGINKCGKEWSHVEALLQQHGVKHTHVFTERRGHAIELAKSAVNSGYTRLVAVGGDGTAHEVANGILTSQAANTADITMGLIEVGTGNDWGRTMLIPRECEKAVEALVKGTTRVQDVAEINFNTHGTRCTRYCINVAGIGYDAFVAKKTNAMKDHNHGGKMAYLWQLVTGLFQYRITHATVTVDGIVWCDEPMFSISVGIGKFNGGGMCQLPNAEPDDGLLDVTFIAQIGVAGVVKNLPGLYDGSFIHDSRVRTVQGRQITITASRPVSLEADGESLGTTSAHFSILDKKLRVVVQ